MDISLGFWYILIHFETYGFFSLQSLLLPCRGCPQVPQPQCPPCTQGTNTGLAPGWVSMWFVACQGFTHIGWVQHHNQAEKIETRHLHPFFSHCTPIRKGKALLFPLLIQQTGPSQACSSLLCANYKKDLVVDVFFAQPHSEVLVAEQGLWLGLFFLILSREQNEQCKLIISR